MRNWQFNTHRGPLDVEQYEASEISSADPNLIREWLTSMGTAFTDDRPSSEHIQRDAELISQDPSTISAVYDPALPTPTGVRTVVGTYESFPGTINLGGVDLVGARFISGVSVRTSHTRRGVLRALITDDLNRAAEQGQPLALLTASQGDIYGRFGFGVVINWHTLKVTGGKQFRLRSELDTNVIEVDPSWVLENSSAFFERHHRQQVGSAYRRPSYPHWLLYSRGSKEINRELHALVATNADGEIIGYLTYRHKTQDEVRQIRIGDFVTLGERAGLALWDHLARMDLVEAVIFGQGSADEPIVAAAANPRHIKVTDVADILWARVLDPVAVVQQRGYLPEAGRDLTFTIEVEDPLGYAAGRYLIEAGDDAVNATADTAAGSLPTSQTHISLEVKDLAPLLLGHHRLSTLVDAGLVQVSDLRPVPAIDRLFQLTERVRFTSGF